MTMLRFRLASLLVVLVASTADAQTAPTGPTPTNPATPIPAARGALRTGDAWVDARLADIGTYAATYRDAFVDEVARYGRAPRELVAGLLARPGWTPGDVYFACDLALQAGRPCREVVDLRGAEPARDWASIATALGVTPGTPGFHALKRAIVASYDRWARPVAVDDELARDFPGRPRAPAATSAPAPKAAKPAHAPARPAGG